MSNSADALLVKAKESFKAYRFVECYQLMRRYFDRLPFEQATTKHAECIGIFTRTLAELGKLRELEFYSERLEHLHKTTRSAEAGYCLAVIYVYANPPRLRAAKRLLDEILRNPPFQFDQDIRAKLLLSHIYASEEDLCTPVNLIQSIEREAKDPTLELLVNVWRAVTVQYQGKLDLAEKMLQDLLHKLSPTQDWYPYFSALDALIDTQLEGNKLREAEQGISKLKVQFAKQKFRTIQSRVKDLEKTLHKKTANQTLQVKTTPNGFRLHMGKHNVRIKRTDESPSFMELLLQKPNISKKELIRKLYKGRGEKMFSSILQDTNQIIEKLGKLGLPSCAVTISNTRIRLLPQINWMEKTYAKPKESFHRDSRESFLSA